MSLLSAGKQIMVGGDKSYGRGLFVMDPDEAERKAQKQQQYQQQLRLQMEQMKRRKDDEKRKDREHDMRLEQKINEDIRRESEKKDKPNNNNDKNVATNYQKSQIIKTEIAVDAPKKNQYSAMPEKFQFKTSPAQMDYPRQNPFLMRAAQFTGEQSRFYEEVSQQKLRNLRQALQQKMGEVYKKIKGSQDLQIDKELDSIRRKIQSYNNSYEGDNPKTIPLEEGYSHFYKVPKKKNLEEPEIPRFKNLNYDGTNSEIS